MTHGVAIVWLNILNMHILAGWLDEREAGWNDLVLHRENFKTFNTKYLYKKKKSCAYLTACLNQTTNDTFKGFQCSDFKQYVKD